MSTVVAHEHDEYPIIAVKIVSLPLALMSSPVRMRRISMRKLLQADIELAPVSLGTLSNIRRNLVSTVEMALGQSGWSIEICRQNSLIGSDTDSCFVTSICIVSSGRALMMNTTDEVYIRERIAIDDRSGTVTHDIKRTPGVLTRRWHGSSTPHASQWRIDFSQFLHLLTTTHTWKSQFRWGGWLAMRSHSSGRWKHFRLIHKRLSHVFAPSAEDVLETIAKFCKNKIQRLVWVLQFEV